VAITGRAAAAAFALALIVLVAPAPGAVLILGDGALVLAVAFDVALAGSVRALTVRRSGPTARRVGDAVPMTLTIVNGGRRTVRARVRDAWPPSAGARPRVLRVTVPAGGVRSGGTELRPTRRGDRQPTRITVRSLGPLGLAGRQGRHVAPWRLRALPAFPARRHLPAALARLRDIEGDVAVRGRGRGAEFDSLREYVVGDDARAVDWRATARRGTVAVRTYRPERDRRILCVLDTGRTSAGRFGDVPRLDHALDAAQLLAAVAVRAGDRVGLIAHDAVARIVYPGGAAHDTLARLTDALATVEPALVETDHAATAATVLRVARQRATIVLFTDLVPAAVDESLLPALPALTRRHTVVVAALRDPALDRLAAGRADARAVYGAAAAEQTLAERRHLAALLRRAGAEVVDAPPARFAVAVTDTYLTLKSAGRL
jgi:uncharacterized protein (DUF58 family)